MIVFDYCQPERSEGVQVIAATANERKRRREFGPLASLGDTPCKLRSDQHPGDRC